MGARGRLADRIEELTAPPPVPVPERLQVVRAAGEVTIDGAISEEAWANATSVEVAAGGASAKFRLIWDDAALYLSADVSDPDLWVRALGQDGDLREADGVELLLDAAFTRTEAPDGDDRQLIVTALGDVLDANGVGPKADLGADFGVERAIIPVGSFGDDSGDTGYLLEARIPWEALGVVPQGGLVVGADLCVNDANATGVASGDWAALEDFAKPSRWNELQLLGAGIMPGNPDTGGPGMTIASTTGCTIGSCGDRPEVPWLFVAFSAFGFVVVRRLRLG
jgi:hypothetical protein